jgi:hypothetical protein
MVNIKKTAETNGNKFGKGCPYGKIRFRFVQIKMILHGGGAILQHHWDM